jgi:tripartite-type tricarboxylate transporter receptor subunit TctC
MRWSRRTMLQLATGAAVLPLISRVARSQSYPARPIRWVVPFPPGGATDVVARIVSQWLSERLGQPVVIENRGGAGGNIGVQAVVNSPPDGYTMLLIPTGATINATLYDSLPYNFLRDIAPVSGLVRSPNVMVVNPALPVRSVAEFIAYTKANPGKVNMASPGTGTAVHMAGEMFKLMTGANMTHVPYRGGAPATADLISGQIRASSPRLRKVRKLNGKSDACGRSRHSPGHIRGHRIRPRGIQRFPKTRDGSVRSCGSGQSARWRWRSEGTLSTMYFAASSPMR